MWFNGEAAWTCRYPSKAYFTYESNRLYLFQSNRGGYHETAV